PMQSGISYIVRPFIEPSNLALRVTFISSGSVQLFVGPASSLRREQIYVRSSTRATSDGCDLAKKLLGRFSSLSRTKVPPATISLHRRLYSPSEPSHQ